MQAVGEHIDVDIVGRCGPLSDGDIPGDEQYKFYLAFENSNCQDYITEKFFNPLRRGDMIPVVMGASKDAYNLYGPQVYTIMCIIIYTIMNFIIINLSRDHLYMWMTSVALQSLLAIWTI